MKLLAILATAGIALVNAAPTLELLTSRQVGPAGDNGRPTNYTVYSFDQLIDHFPTSSRYEPHTNATFPQKYVFDNTYYQPGGPIFLYIGGETDLESRYSNLETGIIQILMEATNGLGIILENRYYGDSYPFNTSTTEELRFLTTEQTIADNAYFAQHVKLENVTDGDNLTATVRPWILYGGSLAGAQTAFSLVEYENLLWGGIASSAPVHVVRAYPEWYYPIQKFGPSDCTTRINNIVDKIDHLVQQNNTQAIQQLKEIFGLGTLTDIRDFAMTIAFPLGGPMNYPTYTWQELNWYPAYDHRDFFDFCNNITDQNAPKNITAVDSLLSNYTNGEAWTGLGGYAEYVKNVVVSACPSEDLIDTTQCFSTQNETFYAETTNSASRSYLYTTCTEQGAYQTAPYDADQPSLVLRVLQVDYTQQWCTWAFEDGVPPNGPNLTTYEQYGGFNISAPRLAFIDGAQDVWNELCYHGSNATAAHNNLRYGENQLLIPGAGHHWDSYGILNVSGEPDFIRAAHEWEIRQVNNWLQEWDQKHSSSKAKDEL